MSYLLFTLLAMLRQSARPLFSIGAMLGCIVTMMLAPDWIETLHALDYFSLTNSGAVRTAEKERRIVGRRLAETLSQPMQPLWGFTLSVNSNSTGRNEDGGNGDRDFDAQAYSFLAGIDRAITDQLRLGLSGGFDFSEQEGFDFTTGTRNKLNTRNTGFSIGPYIQYVSRSNYYLTANAVGGLLRSHSQTIPPPPRLPSQQEPDPGEYIDGYRVSLSLAGGYDWTINRLSLGLYGNASYDLVESTNNRTGNEKKEGLSQLLTLRGGARGTYIIPSKGSLFIVPQIRANYVHREDLVGNNSSAPLSANQSIGLVGSGLFASDAMEFGLGVQCVYGRDLRFWADYQQTFFQDAIDQDLVSLGVRKDF